jgi:hypothetical protein
LTSPILNYATPLPRPPNPFLDLIRRCLRAPCIATATVLISVVGSLFNDGKFSGTIVLVPLVWLGGMSYAVRRAFSGRESRIARIQMSIASAIAILTGSVCILATDLAAIERRGWRSHPFEDIASWQWITAACSLLWFALAQAIDYFRRRRLSRLSVQ